MTTVSLSERVEKLLQVPLFSGFGQQRDLVRNEGFSKCRNLVWTKLKSELQVRYGQLEIETLHNRTK